MTMHKMLIIDMAQCRALTNRSGVVVEYTPIPVKINTKLINLNIKSRSE